MPRVTQSHSLHISSASLLPRTLAQILSGFVTWLGVHYLTEVARKLGGRDTSFGLAAARTYPWMIVIVDLCVWAVSFGLCVAYLTIASSSIPYCVEQFAPGLSRENVLLQTWCVPRMRKQAIQTRCVCVCV